MRDSHRCVSQCTPHNHLVNWWLLLCDCRHLSARPPAPTNLATAISTNTRLVYVCVCVCVCAGEEGFCDEAEQFLREDAVDEGPTRAIYRGYLSDSTALIN